MEMIQVLNAAASSDNIIRKQAEDALGHLERSSFVSVREFIVPQFAEYISHIARELRDDSRADGIRQMAGLLIKNALDAKSETLAAEREARWKALPSAVRAAVKHDLVMSLSATTPLARHAAAQAVAKVGRIEVPAKEWPELFDGLVSAALTDGVAVGTKTASVTALGYLCEEIDDASVVDQAARDKILSAIVNNCVPAAPVELRRAAIKGLLHSLDFAEESFSDARARERDAIVGAAYACMTDADEEVRTTAFSAAIRMAQLYYASLGPYMAKLAGITSATALAEGGSDAIAVSAIEFWSAVAEEEQSMRLDDPANKRFIFTYIRDLVKMLTTLMARVDEDEAEDEYTTAQAAAVCLTHCAVAAEDATLPPAMEFISSGFGHADWRVRDAATLAFGCVLDGPAQSALAPLIAQALGTLVSRLAGASRDANATVRESTAWVLQRVLEQHGHTVDARVHLAPLLTVTFAALDDEPRVAAQAANIVLTLSEHSGARCEATQAMPEGSPLSPYFEPLVSKLLALSDTPAWRTFKLRVNCFEAINGLITDGATELEHPFLMRLLEEAGRRLNVAVAAASGGHGGGGASSDERANIDSQLVHLTALVQMLVTELDADVTPVAPQLVDLLLRAMDARASVTAENAMRAVGAIADAVSEAFSPMLPSVLPRMHACIVNVNEPDVCQAGLWACGEVVRNSGAAVQPHVEAIVITLLDILKKAETSRPAKAAALAVFGDIASSMGVSVAKYIAGMMVMLDKAAKTEPEDPEDPDELQFIEELRMAVAEAWQGLVQAFLPMPDATEAVKAATRAAAAEHLVKYLPHILPFVSAWMSAHHAAAVAPDSEVEEEATLAALKVLVGLVGDIGNVWGKANLGSVGFRSSDPALKAILDLEDRLERESWAGDRHEADGSKKTTIASWARDNMPR